MIMAVIALAIVRLDLINPFQRHRHCMTGRPSFSAVSTVIDPNITDVTDAAAVPLFVLQKSIYE